MKMPTVPSSRSFLLAIALGSALLTPTLFGGTGSPDIPPSAVVLGLKAPPPKLVVSFVQLTLHIEQIREEF
jgi:hypothetical protein